ncbi:MAG: hypothetical protein M1378_03350 [Bacteroidetes bacterium]|nr:hypothetical protein [Bacteroidota bacterium]
MIDSAVKILGPVPAANIDPQLLIQSQTSDASGYVMISYPLEANTLIYDLMLFKSNKVTGSFRLTPDLRFALDAATILQNFRAHKADTACSISLYLASIEQLNRFRDVLHLTPSLKLRPDGLARKQILLATKAVRVQHGYLELNSLDNPADPRVSILDVNRVGKSISRVLRRFSTAQLRSSNCLLLYDIDRNQTDFAGQTSESIAPSFQGGVPDSLDSILESILVDSDTGGEPLQDSLSSLVGQKEISVDSSSESIEENQATPAVEPASPQLIALFAGLRSALVALLGRARAARSLNRALTSSFPCEASRLRPVIEAGSSTDPPVVDTEENAKALIRCCIDVPNHLVLNKRKAREKLGRILADRYSQHYAAFTSDEHEFLESLWKKFTD